jgi:predicted TPR repeat methyltransferase
MRWAVEYELPGGSIGLCIFSAEDRQAAQAFVDEMRTRYGHNDVFNLNELANGTGIEELYQLFPRLASVVNRENMPGKK